jgi:hypothetical protein
MCIIGAGVLSLAMFTGFMLFAGLLGVLVLYLDKTYWELWKKRKGANT